MQEAVTNYNAVPPRLRKLKYLHSVEKKHHVHPQATERGEALLHSLAPKINRNCVHVAMAELAICTYMDKCIGGYNNVLYKYAK